MVLRRASHAGSWYKSEARLLDIELAANLNRVPEHLTLVNGEENKFFTCPVKGARAIIAPHAGYRYSGSAAAWAYKALDWSKADRVFLLGPSHHKYLTGAALTRCSSYQTPFGDLPIDSATTDSLHKSGHFELMDKSTDENEHSLEMHIPYIYKMFLDVYGRNKAPQNFPPLIPIMVGNTSPSTEHALGAILAPYLADPGNFFVISSDFCHWGSRFQYTYGLREFRATVKSHSEGDNSGVIKPIHEYIADVDQESMYAVEVGSHADYTSVLAANGNTVCGRHPIGVVLAMIEEWRRKEHIPATSERGSFRFVRYERSSLVTDPSDSSVSYCSAFAAF